MTDLYETGVAAGELITVQNEHLIPFGSTAGRATKNRTGWSGGTIATIGVLGSRLTVVGDGGVETLAEFKMRARATVLSRMQWEGVRGWDPVRDALDGMGLLRVSEFKPGMCAAWPYDLRDTDLLAHDLVLNPHLSQMRWAKALGTDGSGTTNLVVEVVPVNDAEPWAPENGTWTEWVQFKRLLWEHGETLSSHNGWCSTFQNVMSSLGVDATLRGAVGVTRVNEEVW